MLRNIIAIIVGIVVGSIVIMLVEMSVHAIYPDLPAFNPSDSESVNAMTEAAPSEALLMVVFAYMLGSFVGGAVSVIIPGEPKHIRSLLTGFVLMVSGIFNLIMYPHPVWFWVLGLLVFVPFAYLGGLLAVRRPL